MDRTDLCKLCYEEFGDPRRPRVLPCGHSYCTDCLDKLYENGNLTCPKCKRNHRVSSARDFSINYDLEESFLDAKKAKATVAPAAPSSDKVPKMQTLIAQQKPKIHNLILSAEDIQSQLKGYKDFLLNRKLKHEAVLQKICELGKFHEGLVEDVEEEDKRIVDVQKEGDGYCKEMKGRLANLDTEATDKAAAVALAEVIECSGELEGWIGRCRQEFPHPNITVAEPILMKSIDALSLVDLKRDGNDVPMASAPFTNDLKIMEKLPEIDVYTITLDKLRVKPKHWRKRIAAGQVYAIDSSNGRKRSAKLSEKDGKTYLHYLQDREAPILAHTIEHSEVVKSLNQDSTVVFLDLAWDGSFKGRVHILLSPDTPLARHFRILCTGDSGPSYAHSNFYRVANKNSNHEAILGGDYEYGNGSGGAPVMEGLDPSDDIYNRRWEQGVVLVPKNRNENQMSHFGIITGISFRKYNGVFAHVQDGIDVLKDAARFRDINEVKIINCGVQLPL